MTMIRRSWLPFKIDLSSLNEFLKTIPGSDGIIADIEGFSAVVDESHFEALDTYISSLTMEGELEKLNYPKRLTKAVQDYKMTLITKPYSALTLMDRKLLMNLPLTIEEESSILDSSNQGD